MTVADSTQMEAEFGRARRNVYLLTAAQSVLGSVAPISISLGGLAGFQLLGSDKSLATLPVTGFNFGVTIGAIVVAIIARFLGRREGFMVGAALAAVGGVVAALALYRLDFWLFALGLMIIGVCGGFTQKIRFAAADASPSFYKGKAISWILAGGIISAILGPQIAIQMKDALAPITFAGSFLSIVPLMVVAIAILAFVNLPHKTEHGAASVEPARPLLEIVGSMRFFTGMICGVASYALMSFMMTGAPLAMVIGCGFSADMATLGIQWHVIAMFAPSFFTGMLISRFGSEKIVAAGLLILMACAVVAHSGVEIWNFWLALVLLGVGWNFGFIGATAIVASSYKPQEADKVQGFHDIILFGTVALASLSSGKVFSTYGWDVMTFVIWPITIACLLLVLLQMRKSARKSA